MVTFTPAPFVERETCLADGGEWILKDGVAIGCLMLSDQIGGEAALPSGRKAKITTPEGKPKRSPGVSAD